MTAAARAYRRPVFMSYWEGGDPIPFPSWRRARAARRKALADGSYSAWLTRKEA